MLLVFSYIWKHTHTQKKKRVRWLADQKTMNIRTLQGEKVTKMLWQRRILFRCMPFVWIPLWLHHIQVSAGFSSAKHYQSPFVLSSSVTFSCALFALCPLACYLCSLFSARQGFHQDLHNSLANTKCQGENEVVTNYLTIHVKQELFSKDSTFRAEIAQRLYCTKTQGTGYEVR